MTTFIQTSRAIVRPLIMTSIITAKSVGFLAMMSLNFSFMDQAGNQAMLSVSLNTAQACPDDVSDCMVVTPDENDSMEHGSGGGLVFGGGSSAGGGTVGSGGGSGGNSGSSGSSGTNNGGSIDDIEQCKLDAFEIKLDCKSKADALFIAAQSACLLAIFPPAIAGCEVLIFNEKQDFLNGCDFAYEINVANCD